MVLSDYKHSVKVRVRTFDVDSQGIVHNINYLKYFEIGRVEYRRNMGYSILPDGIFNDGLKVVVVRNEINYKSYSFLDDILNVYTKISWVNNSSFCFEHTVINENTGKIAADGLGILVNLNKDNLPETLNSKFLSEIETFENIKLKK